MFKGNPKRGQRIVGKFYRRLANKFSDYVDPEDIEDLRDEKL